MTLKQAALQINSLAGWGIHLGYYDEHGVVKFLNMDLDRLYEIWGNGLPESWQLENGSIVYGVIFACHNGRIFLVDGTPYPTGDMTFEEVMLEIQKRIL